MTSFIGLTQKNSPIKVNLSVSKYNQKNTVITDCKRQNSLLNEQKVGYKGFQYDEVFKYFSFSS